MGKELITPVTHRLLEERRGVLEQRYTGAQAKYGSSVGGEGGDAEHGEEQYLFLDKHDQAARQLVDFKSATANTEFAAEPTQHEYVEPNHRVQIFFDGDESDSAHVTIVTPVNLNVLKDWKIDGRNVFDTRNGELLVSTESPMAGAMLGHKKGETVSYKATEVKTVFETKIKIGEIYTANIF